MAATLQNTLDQALRDLVLPMTGQTLVQAGARVLEVAENAATVALRLGFPCRSAAAELSRDLSQKLSEATNSAISVNVESAISTHAVQGTLSPLAQIANILVISSAKGGVGKSTVAANLALGLAHEGARVGMLDADIYGPSQPIMLGVAGEQPESRDGKTFEPIMAHGLPMISIGCLIDTEQPMVWRGPMVTQALNQLLFQTNWPELDYLIIDMPPGTGDIQLTLSQKVPVSGAVIVTTPQDIALADAVRGLRMFEKVHIPVLGLIENMSTFVCPSCGEVTSLFGQGGGAEVARANNLRLLGQLPLDLRIREETDSGKPTVLADPESAIAKQFIDAAVLTAAQLSLRPKDYSRKLGKINVEPA
jgi:ATP-binding protein involved in chromosome partitioning